MGVGAPHHHSGGRRLDLTTVVRAEPTARKAAGLTAQKPSYGMAAIAALAVFALYLATLAPTTAMWDTSEYIAAVKVLGLPHPPGNPLFVLLDHVFDTS